MKARGGHKNKYIGLALAIGIAMASGITGLFLHLQYKNTSPLEPGKAFTWEELWTEPVISADEKMDNEPVKNYPPPKKTEREQFKDLPTLSPLKGEINKKELAGKNLDLKRIEKRKKYIRNNFTDFITTSKSTYLSREPRGVYDVFIVVQNNSEYNLDLVTIDVQYLSRERGILQTNQFLVENIKPFQQKMVEAYDNDNATDVNIIISSIISTEMDFCFSAEKLNSNNPDPYYCDTLKISFYTK